MQVIYIRVSTEKQDAGSQLDKLRQHYPNAGVVEETASGVKSRPALMELVSKLTKGDELIVTALDRLGRRTSEILTLIEGLEAKGVILKSLREGIDYSTMVGKLVTQILCSVAEMERNMISERTKMALDAKRKLGIVGGRPRKYTDAQVTEIRHLHEFGHKIKVIADRTGVSAARVSQLLRQVEGAKV